MEYPLKSEYLNIIDNSLNPDYDKPEFYFYQQYLIFKEKDANFIERLRFGIQTVEHEVCNITQDEYGIDYDWVNHYFYFDNGKIIVKEDNDFLSTPSQYIHSQTTPKILLESYNAFVLMTQSEANKAEVNNEFIKLKWNGNKNQLYSVIRQLKIDHEKLTDSNEVLAKFIKQSFISFSSTQLSTILKELSKNKKLPHRNRISVDPDIEYE